MRVRSGLSVSPSLLVSGRIAASFDNRLTLISDHQLDPSGYNKWLQVLGCNFGMQSSVFCEIDGVEKGVAQRRTVASRRIPKVTFNFRCCFSGHEM